MLLSKIEPLTRSAASHRAAQSIGRLDCCVVPLRSPFDAAEQCCHRGSSSSHIRLLRDPVAFFSREAPALSLWRSLEPIILTPTFELNRGAATARSASC